MKQQTITPAGWLKGGGLGAGLLVLAFIYWLCVFALIDRIFAGTAIERFRAATVQFHCADAEAIEDVIAAVEAGDLIQARAIARVYYGTGRCVHTGGALFTGERVAARHRAGLVLEGRLENRETAAPVYVFVPASAERFFLVPGADI